VTLVGLPDTEVREARDRVRAAIQNCGFEFPQRRITVNLAPADLPKESGRFDLPIALGILIASSQISTANLASYEFAGELALSGDLRAVRGALAMCAAFMAGARDREHREGGFILPRESAAEAALVPGLKILAADNLLQVCAHLSGRESIPPYTPGVAQAEMGYPDLQDVKGQGPAKRALEIAAAGGHSLLMSGPPGTGKSMLAHRLPGLLPPMSTADALETAAVHSLAGCFSIDRWRQRPYRAPHHSASMAALVGGGSLPRPGEISLAHHGVLFLDELPEFQRNALDALREPLETGHIHVSRAAHRATFPACFQLVAAMNPCPCGYLGNAAGKCRCTPDLVARYRAKLSGPFLDRIDLMIEVPQVTEAELSARVVGEPSAVVHDRVMVVRDAQMRRQGKSNAMLLPHEIDLYAQPDQAGTQLLKQAMSKLSLSARGFHRILKVARTLADMAGENIVSSPDIAEAIQYRRGLNV
jgi:magnesium chelatase family protein